MTKFATFMAVTFPGALIAAGSSLVPCWLTYDAPGGDGMRIMGFPGTFRTYGGMSPHLTYYPLMLVIDLVADALFVAALGWLAIRLHSRSDRFRRGFPVVPLTQGKSETIG